MSFQRFVRLAVIYYHTVRYINKTTHRNKHLNTVLISHLYTSIQFYGFYASKHFISKKTFTEA